MSNNRESSLVSIEANITFSDKILRSNLTYPSLSSANPLIQKNMSKAIKTLIFFLKEVMYASSEKKHDFQN